MYGFLTKLLLSKRLKFTDGEIIFVGENLTLFPLKTMKMMTEDAEKNGKRAVQQLYFYGWDFGFTFTLAYKRSLKLKKFEDTYKSIMDVAAMIGYGDYKTFEFRRQMYSKYENIKNPFALLFYPSKEKHCHFIRGANAGGGAALHAILMNGIELKCASQNGEGCIFMNVNNKILKEEFPKETEEQLDLDWLRPKQLELIKECGEDVKAYEVYPKKATKRVVM